MIPVPCSLTYLARLLCTVLVIGIVCAADVKPGDAALAKYTGPGSCSSPSCHGSVQPRTDSSAQQNEYTAWAVKDRHTKAYEGLTNPMAQRISRILAIA